MPSPSKPISRRWCVWKGELKKQKQAEKLVEKFKAKAEAIADEIEPTELRELLYYLVDSVLERELPVEPEEALLQLVPLGQSQ